MTLKRAIIGVLTIWLLVTMGQCTLKWYRGPDLSFLDHLRHPDGSPDAIVLKDANNFCFTLVVLKSHVELIRLRDEVCK